MAAGGKPVHVQILPSQPCNVCNFMPKNSLRDLLPGWPPVMAFSRFPENHSRFCFGYEPFGEIDDTRRV
jgi:hypothetical protein